MSRSASPRSKDQRMFALALWGKSSAKIAQVLTGEGIKNSRGRDFSAAAVRWILHSGFYTGKVQYADQGVEADHEPIISPVVFGKVQAALRRGAKNSR